MPRKEESLMDQKTQFISGYLRGSLSFTDLFQRYHISRKTGYKWITRYQTQGPAGLLDRSRRPLSSPTKRLMPYDGSSLMPAGAIPPGVPRSCSSSSREKTLILWCRFSRAFRPYVTAIRLTAKSFMLSFIIREMTSAASTLGPGAVKGKPIKAEALRQAALKVMRNSETRHPFYRAGSCWWVTADEATCGSHLSRVVALLIADVIYYSCLQMDLADREVLCVFARNYFLSQRRKVC
jgi:hypothetical protein